MLYKLLICSIGLIAVTNADDTCTFTDRYVYYPELEISYKFNVRALVWGKAREYCLNENATLAVPKNVAERNTLMKIFEEYPAEKIIAASYSNHILLGFHDFFEENEFLSELGYDIDYFYRDFETGQPGQGRGENCLSMDRNGKYHDYPHGGTAAFICQRDHSNYEKKLMGYSRTNSDPGYITDSTSQKRYKLHTDLKTWGIARAICFAEGGNLAIIRNRQEEMFLVDLLNNPKNNIHYSKFPGYAFVGVHDMFIEGQFVTVKGERLDSINYVRWANGQPNGGGGQNCIVIFKSGEIYDASCDVPNMYICEISSDTHEENYFNNI